LKTSAEYSLNAAFPPELDLQPLSRRPTVLSPATVGDVLGADLARLRRPEGHARPLVSIVVVTFNGLVFTRLCLESLLAYTDDPVFEVVVVDNASSDGTLAYLFELAERFGALRVVPNSRNLGFAPAVNKGLAASRGELLVLLNNDTIVTPGWLRRLVGRLVDDTCGLVGPTTNRGGGESEIDVSYRTYGELLEFAARQAEKHLGATRALSMPAMFCVGFRRDLYERVGPLDERYEVGNFEDEDYALRAGAAGYRNLLAEDVFVHHFAEASFGELYESGERGRVFASNQLRFEEKWRRPWQPAPRQPSARYTGLRRRIRKAVIESVPEGSTLAMVSRGDDDLLRVEGRTAVHFPQEQDGRWTGGHPGSSAEAIAHLEELRGRGAGFLVLPATAFWWLDYYEDFRRHLEHNYPPSLERRDACIVFALGAQSRP
jgi:GT2 family glycosyltransferase